MSTAARNVFGAALLVLWFSASATAQEESPAPEPAEEKTPDLEQPSGRPLKIRIDLESWWAQPTGLDHVAAHRFDQSTGYVEPVVPTDEVEVRPRVRLSVGLPKNVGQIVGTYYSLSQDRGLSQTDPGNFAFLEGLGESTRWASIKPPDATNPGRFLTEYEFLGNPASSFYAGLFDDGFADGFSADVHTGIRDFGIGFARPINGTERLHATWYLGLRRIVHHDSMSMDYAALLPDDQQFPTVLPPVVGANNVNPDLVPINDTLAWVSDYEGRGVEARIDFEFPFGAKQSFSIEGGLGVAALRGRLHAQYDAVAWAYCSLADDETCSYIPPEDFNYHLAEDPARYGATRQVGLLSGVTVPSKSTGSEMIEAYLGFRWKPWRTIQLFAGMRDTRYGTSGSIVRPTASGMQESPLSTTVEGYYVGMSYAF